MQAVHYLEPHTTATSDKVLLVIMEITGGKIVKKHPLLHTMHGCRWLSSIQISERKECKSISNQHIKDIFSKKDNFRSIRLSALRLSAQFTQVHGNDMIQIFSI